ncbi:hypothetical protein D9M69_359730 [compost metagenome]
MDDSSEEILEVDTFGQAVRGHQDAGLALAQLFNGGFALTGCEFPSYGLDRSRLELVAQISRQVVRRGDVAAKHDWLEAFFQQ